MSNAVTADPIRLYVDFASPYAYFILDPMARLAQLHRHALVIRPFLLWAVLKQHGLTNPIEAPARRAYFLSDVVRSAAFFGAPFRIPDKLQISAHLATRLFYGLTESHPERALDIARDIFTAQFVNAVPITDAAVLAELPCAAGLPTDELRDMIGGPLGRQRLAEAIDEAVAVGVTGSPFVVMNGEGFFGADRLPQIAWRLGGTEAPDR